MIDPVVAIFSLIVLLFSVIIHELAHGYVADSLGDPTAKYAGRLTLNPTKHLDLFGSIILPLMLFITGSPFLVGWAKPVPTNPYNFSDQKWGSLKVAIAGPLSNISLALVFGLILRFMPTQTFVAFSGFSTIFIFIVQINLMLALFNLIPIPPLDGHWILFTFISDRFFKFKQFLQQYGIYILLALLFLGALKGLGGAVEYFFRLITGI